MNEGEWLLKMLMLDALLHHITLLKIGGNCPRFAKPLILIHGSVERAIATVTEP